MVTLVTGATGFIGRTLVRNLVGRGRQVRAFLRPSSDASSLAGLPVEIVRGALDEKHALQTAFRGASEVFHIASPGLADMVRERLSVEEMISPLLEAALDGCSPRFVYLSTLKARLPGDEGQEGRQDLLDVYGQRKRNEEQRLMLEKELPWTIVRAAAVYGPGDRKSLPIFKMATGPVVPLIRQEELGRFSLVHVEQLVNVLALTAERSGAVHEIYEVGDLKGYTWNELMQLLAGPDAKKIEVPPSVLRVFGSCMSLLSRFQKSGGLLVRDRVTDLLERNWVASRKMAFDCPGEQSDSQAGDGLKATLRWYQLNGWLPHGGANVH